MREHRARLIRDIVSMLAISTNYILDGFRVLVSSVQEFKRSIRGGRPGGPGVA